VWIDFLFNFFLPFNLYDDVPLYRFFLFSFLVIMFSFSVLIWHGRRRRERDLFLFAALSGTKARERLRQVFKRGVLAALCQRRFAHKSLWRRRHDLLTISMTVCRTAPT